MISCTHAIMILRRIVFDMWYKTLVSRVAMELVDRMDEAYMAAANKNYFINDYMCFRYDDCSRSIDKDINNKQNPKFSV